MERKMSEEEKEVIESFIKNVRKDCEMKLFVVNKLKSGRDINEEDELILKKLHDELSA
jgi:hypothetical protein